MKEQPIKLDSKENFYVDIDNVRITIVKKENRKAESNWSGKDTLRIQAYQEGTSGRLMQGAEFPIGSMVDVSRFAVALFALVGNELEWSKVGS